MSLTCSALPSRRTAPRWGGVARRLRVAWHTHCQRFPHHVRTCPGEFPPKAFFQVSKWWKQNCHPVASVNGRGSHVTRMGRDRNSGAKPERIRGSNVSRAVSKCSSVSVTNVIAYPTNSHSAGTKQLPSSFSKPMCSPMQLLTIGPKPQEQEAYAPAIAQ